MIFMRFVTSSLIVSRRRRNPSNLICGPSTCPRRADRRTGGGRTILLNRSFLFPERYRRVRYARFHYYSSYRLGVWSLTSAYNGMHYADSSIFLLTKLVKLSSPKKKLLK